VQEYEELEDFPLVFQNVSKDQYISTKRSRSKNRNLMECQRTSLSSESDWSIRTNLIQETPPSNVEFSPKNIPSDTSVDAVSFSPVGPSVSTTTTTSTKNVPKNIRTALSIDAVRFSPVGASVSATTTTTTKNVPFFNKISQKKIDYLSFLLDICDQSHIDTWDTFSDRWAYNLSLVDFCMWRSYDIVYCL
jgi:hypothetical protein